MRVKYVGKFDAVDLDGVGTVTRNEVIEVDSDLGSSLLDQKSNWKAAPTPRPEKETP